MAEWRQKFRDAAIRLGHPVVIEQKFLPGDTDFARELGIIRDSRADAIVLWADQSEAAGILKQMRAMGMKQRVFGGYRTLGPICWPRPARPPRDLKPSFPTIPRATTRAGSISTAASRRASTSRPEQFASLAYDAMNILLESICSAGLNRARIHDALDQVDQYDGVTGHMVFDPNNKNVSPMFLGTVHNGAITYRPATISALPGAPHPCPQDTVGGARPHTRALAKAESNITVPRARGFQRGERR